MSVRPDGSYECDRCGADCGNGGVVESLVVSDLDFSIEGDENSGHVRNLHFCRDRKEDNKTIKGCASKVISARNIEFYLNRRRKEESHDSAEASSSDPSTAEGGITGSSSGSKAGGNRSRSRKNDSAAKAEDK